MWGALAVEMMTLLMVASWVLTTTWAMVAEAKVVTEESTEVSTVMELQREIAVAA